MNEIWHHTVTRNGGTSIVALHGELDMGGREALVKVLVDELARPDTIAVRADLGGVDFMDSSGMQALINAYHVAEGMDRGFVVVGAQGNVRKALDLVGLLSFLTDGTPPASPTAADRLAG
jgi:stage II sporulation protein AA (anti-sigma F factor antagonist)